jgi:hypothetical protein
MNTKNDIIHFVGGALMRNHMLFLAFIFFGLCGGEALFVPDQAYGWCSGCCMCTYGGGYRSCSGCVPPGGIYNGVPCPTCAAPDPEAIQARTPSYNGSSGTRAIRELSPSVIRQLDPTNGVLTLIRGGQCMRRSVELRLLSTAGEGLSLYERNGLERAVQIQIAAQAN